MGLGGRLWPTGSGIRTANILLLLTTVMIVAIYWAPIICWPLNYVLYLYDFISSGPSKNRYDFSLSWERQ